jgi:hypothetical protein
MSVGEPQAMRDETQALPADETVLSNSFRLSIGQWLVVGLFSMLVVVVAPRLWKQVESFPLEPDYRIPHELANDYWLYERFAGMAADHYDMVLLGDSVIWGEYVTRDQTLSHYLNKFAGKERFANLGLDGAHPLALAGLVEHYAKAVKDKNVLLQCNPLWMSSLRADLQDDKATEFNHPRLVPQFVPRLPSYKEENSPRIGVLVEQRVTFSGWTNHLQQAYFDRTDLPGWTLEHPYANPLAPLLRGLPPLNNSLRHPPRPWYKNGISPQDYPWVELDKSLQWQAFQRLVDVLQRRGNRLCVLVGPFNEHLLTPSSREQYQHIKDTITKWLETRRIRHVAPSALPSALYGDASHPLAGGYEMLARELVKSSLFQSSDH